MKPWKTLVLGILLLIVGGYIRYVELPQEEKRREGEFFLEGMTERSLRFVSVDRKGASFSLKNQKPVDSAEKNIGGKDEPDSEAEWVLEGVPAGTKLDRGSVQSLLGAVTSLKLGDAIPAEEVGNDLKVFGLDEPAVTVRVGVSSGEKTLKFGKRSEFVGQRYVQVPDEGLFMVDDALFSAADKDRDSLRQTSPLLLELKDFTSIDIESSDGPVRLEKADGDEWKVVKPVSAKADQQFVSEFVRRVRSLRAKDFIDPPRAEQLSEFGLDRPDVTVTFGGEKKKLEVKLAVKVTAASEGEGKSDVAMYFWFNESPSVYRIEGNQINLFRLPAESFRDKHVLDMTREAVTRIEAVKEGGQVRTLEKGAGGWKLDGAEANSPKVDSYLDGLSDLTVEKFATAEDAAEPFGSPIVRLTIREGEKEGIWEVGSESKLQLGRLHPLRKGDGTLLGYLTPDRLEQITPKDDLLLKRNAADTPTSGLKEVRDSPSGQGTKHSD